jgi:hypothetical protein
VARFGDNMRNVAVTEGDKVEAEIRLGVSVNTWGVNDLVAVVDAVEDRRIAELVASTRTRTTSSRAAHRRRPARLAARGARIEAGLRTFLTDGGFGAFTTNFEDLGGLRQLPGIAVQRLMADGYGFGGEGDWKTSVLLRTIKAMADGLPGGHLVHGGLHLPPGPGTPKTLGAHMLEVCPSIAAARPSCEVHRSASAAARTRSAGVRRRARARPSSWGCPTSGTASGWWPTRWTPSRRTSRCRTCPSPARCGPPGRTSPPRPSPGCWPAARTTPSTAARCRPRSLHDFATIAGLELALDRRRHEGAPLRRRAALERRLPPARPADLTGDRAAGPARTPASRLEPSPCERYEV